MGALFKHSLLLVAALLWLFASGCDRHDHPHGAKGEEPEEKTAQVTHWDDRYEIFLEHKLIVAGAPTKFVTHITDLKTLEPRREGPVTFVMKTASEAPTEKVQPAPEKPGIYIPELTFPKAGEWSVYLRIPTDGADKIVELPKFIVYASREEAHKAPEQEAPEGISFLKEQQWKILSKTDPVGKRKLVERVRLAGVVAVKPGTRGAVTPPVAGQLLPPRGKTLPSVGAKVEAGQVLAMVQPPLAGADLLNFSSNQFQMKALETEFAVKFAEVEANGIREKVAARQANLALARVQELFNKNAKSQRELEEAETAAKTADANLAAAAEMKKTYVEAKARLASLPQATQFEKGFPALELRAPVSGIVTQVSGTEGEQVAPEKPVFTILDPRVVHIEARVPESQLSRISAAKGATYLLPGEKGRHVQVLGDGGGRVVFLGLEVDPATRTVPLAYEVANPEGKLRIGMSLDVFVETIQAQDALAIPESAIVDEDGRPVAFVQVSGETFQKRELTLGIRDSGWVQVQSGLAEGERVATKGAYSIKLASVSTSIPAHGHAH